jgi:hypothetical protein
MNLTAAIVRCYENMRFEKQTQNKPNSKPIKANSNPKQTQSKPISRCVIWVDYTLDEAEKSM